MVDRSTLINVTSHNVRLRKRGDELFVTIGNFKREMILPTVLAKRKAGGGRLVGGTLEITFLPPEPVEESGAGNEFPG